MRRYIDGKEVVLETSAKVLRAGDRLYVQTHEGTDSAVAIRDGETSWISFRGNVYRLEKSAPRIARGTSQKVSDCRSPMPGLLVEIRVKVGDRIEKGDTLAVIEAMKTHLPIQASSDGVVAAVKATVGDHVVEGSNLIELFPPESDV